MIDNGVFRLKSAITCIRCISIDVGSEIWQYSVPSSYMYCCFKRKHLLSREEPLGTEEISLGVIPASLIFLGFT